MKEPDLEYCVAKAFSERTIGNMLGHTNTPMNERAMRRYIGDSATEYCNIRADNADDLKSHQDSEV